MSDKAQEQIQLERVVFFSDAVFAIAITLLIIEVHLPDVSLPTEAALGDALLALIPRYIGFVVSFLVIGRFWIGHHRVFGMLAGVDDRLIWRNLLFLMTIAFMPFPTTLISSYAGTRVGVGFYTAALLLAGLLNVAVIRYALAGPLVAAHAAPATIKRFRRAAWSPAVIGVAAFACGMISPLLALVPLLASPLVLALLNRLPKAAA